ncbi:WecB/TagA/CpsF family glycosyltransferase [Amnibacterium sp.]|uniref:WecB/TagA/CpsF family glycosyltransferase n=1 Tax=Amnibacterium sp. TaxID=1872496 RepID=UPI00261CCE98|nr:WecB/TagA/CpsF family glycosyltransferase [Amnibacterium sp.]MCU1473942.1 hypothetical protein [Amnibacterium sp.]
MTVQPIGGVEAPAGGDRPLIEQWGPRRQTVGGLRFVATTPVDAVRVVVAEATRPGRTRGEHIHLANAYSVALSSKDRRLGARAFRGRAWNLPDGKPLGWVSHSRGHSPRLAQVPGPHFFLDVCRAGTERQLRHYLLGGAPEVLATLETQLRGLAPGIRIVGAVSPPFREATPAELADRDAAIRDSGAQVVWVGLGTPKQDIEAARIAASLPVIAIAIGAGFDYTAGTLRHAPEWMSAVGLEWFFRFLMEPRRLWRRYFFGNLRFVGAVLQDLRRTTR